MAQQNLFESGMPATNADPPSVVVANPIIMVDDYNRAIRDYADL